MRIKGVWLLVAALMAVCLGCKTALRSRNHGFARAEGHAVSPRNGCGGGAAVAGADSLVMLFTGDVMLGRDVGRLIRHGGADRLFSQSVDSLFATAHVVVANIECPVTQKESPLNKRFVFRADTTVLPVLRKHGITHLNMANNHTIDHGRVGLEDTYNNILNAGMVPIGYGGNDSEACRPVMVGGGPRPVFVLASLRVMSENYVYMPDRPSVAEASVGRLCDSVRAIRRRVPSACIVVCLHWGVEHTLHPTLMQRHEGRMLVDAGADAVIGHHSHTAQDVEIYRHRPIFYSLGNFIFDLDRPLNRRGLVAKLTVTADSLLVDSLPVEIRKCVPEVVGRVRQPAVGGMGAGR